MGLENEGSWRPSSGGWGKLLPMENMGQVVDISIHKCCFGVHDCPLRAYGSTLHGGLYIRVYIHSNYIESSPSHTPFNSYAHTNRPVRGLYLYSSPCDLHNLPLRIDHLAFFSRASKFQMRRGYTIIEGGNDMD